MGDDGADLFEHLLTCDAWLARATRQLHLTEVQVIVAGDPEARVLNRS